MKKAKVLICSGLMLFFLGCSQEKSESEVNEEISDAMEEVENAMEEVEDAMEQVEDAMDEIELTLDEVPEIVRQAFEEAYSSIEEVEWEMEGEYFEAEFDMDGKEIGIYFTSEGIEIAKEVEIEMSELPQVILDALNDEYGEFDVDEVSKLNMKDEILFEIEFETEELEIEIKMDENGGLIEKRESKREREEDL